MGSDYLFAARVERVRFDGLIGSSSSIEREFSVDDSALDRLPSRRQEIGKIVKQPNAVAPDAQG